MSLEDHIKVASTELSKAAELAKIEIDKLRSQKSDIKRDRDIRMAQIISHISEHEKEVNRAQDSASKTQARSVISTLQRELADQKSNTDKVIREIDESIKVKNNQIQSLESQSRSLL